jgi:hypothetical protein
MKTKFIPEGLFDKAVVRQGVPCHEITTAAKRLKAGLIVLTTHGRTGLSHILMGSTAERVVRYARGKTRSALNPAGHCHRIIQSPACRSPIASAKKGHGVGSNGSSPFSVE